MLDEREGPVAPEELPRAFNRQSVWRRFAIVARRTGRELPARDRAVLGTVHGRRAGGEADHRRPGPGHASRHAPGCVRGDTIRAINGDAVASWQEVRWHVLQLALDRKDARLEVQGPSGALDWRTLDLAQVKPDEVEGDLLSRLGLRLFRPEVPPVIGQVVSGGVAERAGLLARDRVLAIDGQTIATWEALVAKVRGSPARALLLDVDRAGNAAAHRGDS